MGLLDFISRSFEGNMATDMSDAISTQAENDFLRAQLDSAEMRMEDLEESLLEIADAFDNIGFAPLDARTSNEMPLATVKKASEVARALDAVNPFVKRGVNARVSYIWGNGVEFENANTTITDAIKNNRTTMFSQQAYEERERAAATDGNVFTALHRDNHTMFRVPLMQIVGSVSNPDNNEEIWLYKREWTVKTKNGNTEEEKEATKTRYYPSLAYARVLEDSGKNMPTRWGKFGVDQKYVMQHTAVNKQIGWRWGTPDIMAVIYWAKAYKEYLEDNITLVKAYSRIAWQIKAASQGAANSAAAQWAQTPTRDPLTGELQDVGGTAVTGRLTEIVPTGLNASAVDFEGGTPLSAAVASGLEVSLDVILSSAENSGEGSTLDLPTLRAMKSRQDLWGNSFLDLFEFWGDDEVKVTWGAIDEDETHRRVQSVQLAYEGGLLFQEEARKETLKTLKMVAEKDGLPVAPSIVAAEKAAENAQKVAAAKPSVVPGQGRSGAVGSINSGRGQVRAAAKKSMVNK